MALQPEGPGTKELTTVAKVMGVMPMQGVLRILRPVVIGMAIVVVIRTKAEASYFQNLPLEKQSREKALGTTAGHRIKTKGFIQK